MFHALATLMMTGIIWFVQLVHYPLFALVGQSRFGLYILRNRIRTAVTVTPIMTVELCTAFLLLLPGIDVGLPIRIAGAVLVLILWTSTLAIQWPLHRKLQRGYDLLLHRRLLRSNWVRTIGWSLRGAIAIEILRQSGLL